MKLNVRLFATLKERAGKNEIEVNLAISEPTVKDMLEALALQAPALALSLPTVLVAVNKEYAFSQQVLSFEDEVALFPPVSGG